jgi:hypothetical protein
MLAAHVHVGPAGKKVAKHKHTSLFGPSVTNNFVISSTQEQRREKRQIGGNKKKLIFLVTDNKLERFPLTSNFSKV